MRIDNNDLSGINSSAAGGSQKLRPASELRPANEQDSAVAGPGKAGSGHDEVQLSNVADRVSAGGLSADQPSSAEHAAKIAQLTKLVQSGQYHPDPEKVADSMIRDMLSGTGSS